MTPTTARSRYRFLVLVLAVIFAVAGCGSQSSTSHLKTVPGAQTAAQANQEYIAEEAKLPGLPTGSSWPAPHIAAADAQGVEDTYQPGFGYQMADGQWECIWMKRMLADRVMSSGYTSDLNALGEYKKSYIYANQPVARETFDPLFRSAQLGDTGGISTYYAANCQP